MIDRGLVARPRWARPHPAVLSFFVISEPDGSPNRPSLVEGHPDFGGNHAPCALILVGRLPLGRRARRCSAGRRGRLWRRSGRDRGFPQLGRASSAREHGSRQLGRPCCPTSTASAEGRSCELLDPALVQATRSAWLCGRALDLPARPADSAEPVLGAPTPPAELPEPSSPARLGEGRFRAASTRLVDSVGRLRRTRARRANSAGRAGETSAQLLDLAGNGAGRGRRPRERARHGAVPRALAAALDEKLDEASFGTYVERSAEEIAAVVVPRRAPRGPAAAHEAAVERPRARRSTAASWSRLTSEAPPATIARHFRGGAAWSQHEPVD